MSTRRTSPDLDVAAIMCLCLCLPQLFSMCVAISLVAGRATEWGAAGNWSMSIWCFCFAMTLVFLPDGPYRDWVAAASAFSCVISALYARDVACTWVAYGFKEVPCFVHTVPGLLKVLETFMAYVVSACNMNTSLYLHQPALEWCVAMYSICFILAAAVLLLDLGKWEYRLPGPFSLFQLVLTLLSVLLYISALVLWPLYQFSEELGGQPQRSSDGDCRDKLTYDMCTCDQRLVVAVLTATNLLVYVADLGYWARQVLVGTEDQPRDS
ncbi:hypothetical protein CapIbe_018444 [Capra ibex]